MRIFPIDNPYQPPEANIPVRQHAPIEQAETLIEATTLGTRVAVKWVTIILGPCLCLTLLGAVGISFYRSVRENDWSNVLSIEQLSNFGQLFVMMFISYFVACFWSALFGGLMYSASHIFNRGVTGSGGNHDNGNSDQ